MGSHWDNVYDNDTIEYSQDMFCQNLFFKPISKLLLSGPTVLPARNDSHLMFCLQSYQGLRIDRSLVY